MTRTQQFLSKLLAPLLLFAFGGMAYGQVSVLQQPGTVIGSFTSTATLTDNGTTTNLLTVPAGRVARVTDVFVTNHAASYCLANIASDSNGLLLEVVTQPNSTQHFPMLNGFGLVSGTTLYAYIQSDGANGISCNHVYANYERRVTVRGYYFTVP